jgi:hypothetical protein
MINEMSEIDKLLTREYSDTSSIAESPDVYIIAGSERLSPHQLSLLAYCGTSAVRGRVAVNSSTPTWLLYHLSQDEDSRVREMIADNPSTPKDLLKALSRDKNADVRYCLAENYQMPLDILQLLLEDENPFVSTRAARTLKRKLRNARLDERGMMSQYHLLTPRHLRALESVS